MDSHARNKLTDGVTGKILECHRSRPDYHVTRTGRLRVRHGGTVPASAENCTVIILPLLLFGFGGSWLSGRESLGPSFASLPRALGVVSGRSTLLRGSRA